MRKTVLVADDEPSLRLMIWATFSSDRWAVVEAANGDEAWALIRHHRPAAVVLDVQMPGRSGLDLTRAIRDDPDLTDTWVVLLTARAQETDKRAGLEAGADRYITKPFSPLELLSIVEGATGGA
jgi:two-component system alkaline phosphatase synthesis response regulator PhoP